MTKILESDLRPAGGKAVHPGGRVIIQKAAIVRSLFLAVLLMMIAPALIGQALPTAEASPVSTGFYLPHAAGTLQYAVSASESLVWGYYGSGASSSTNVTGDLAYLSVSTHHPFSMVFAGGHSFSTSNQPSYNFLNFGLSQVANLGRWNFVFSDNVNYTPATPTTGLSGILGVGDLGLNPVQVGADTGQGVLTNYALRVTNTVSGSVQRQFTGKTSASASGSYGIIRFLDNNVSPVSGGLNSDSVTGGGGINHRIDARTSVGGNYSYSTYSYTDKIVGIPSLGFVSQTASALYTHQFTRKFGMSASAGPQWTRINSANSIRDLSFFADVSGEYTGEFSHASAAYVRSTNSGFGVTGGARSDSVMFVVNRVVARVWNGAITTSYTRSESLPSPLVVPFSFNTTLAGVQVSRAIVRSLSAYASFTVAKQSSNGGAAVNAFSGLSQVLGFGLTYSPTSIHVGRP